MDGISTREAAKRLGISPIALSRYIANGKVPTPAVITLGRSKVHVWTDAEIEQVRSLLPKIANGRKTRWQKQREAQKEKRTIAKKRAQARAPAPHKKK